MDRLLVVAALTTLIHLINTLIYSVRVSGLMTGRLATAISLFNVIFLLSSTANMIQGPLLATMVEGAIHRGGLEGVVPGGEKSGVFPSGYLYQLGLLAADFRLVILYATVGTVLGILLMPLFEKIFVRFILIFESVGTVPGAVLSLVFSAGKAACRPGNITAPPAREKTGEPVVCGIPPSFLLMNVIVTGIFTTGVLSALYAGALYPGYRASATMLASVVNGVAQVLFATVVDPTAARITDQAIRGLRNRSEVRRMAYYLAGTRIAGTLLAQAFFLPAAYLIRHVALLIT
ncbi:MAG: lipid II flippase Amj family protein [Bacillota bacterium]